VLQSFIPYGEDRKSQISNRTSAMLYACGDDHQSQIANRTSAMLCPSQGIFLKKKFANHKIPLYL
jgi:hypothetical protein